MNICSSSPWELGLWIAGGITVVIALLHVVVDKHGRWDTVMLGAWIGVFYLVCVAMGWAVKGCCS